MTISRRRLRTALLCAITALLAASAEAQPAVASLNSVASNSGFYSNTIVDATPPRPYTEVCFVDGTVLADVHEVSEPTAGGNCLPGDTGWVIERSERPDLIWADARMSCLVDGMRLPEPFEWGFTCNRQVEFGMIDMIGNIEWASNSAHSTRNNHQHGAPDRQQAGTMGVTSCAATGAGRIDNPENQYRCVR